MAKSVLVFFNSDKDQPGEQLSGEPFSPFWISQWTWDTPRRGSQTAEVLLLYFLAWEDFDQVCWKWYCINFDQETSNNYKAFLTTITAVLIIIIKKNHHEKPFSMKSGTKMRVCHVTGHPRGKHQHNHHHHQFTMSSKTHTSPVEEQHQDASLWYDQPAQRWAPPTRTAHTLPGAGSEKNIAHIIRCWAFQRCFSTWLPKSFQGTCKVFRCKVRAPWEGKVSWGLKVVKRNAKKLKKTLWYTL